MSKVAVKWLGSQLMLGLDSFGHPVVTGSWPERSPEWAGLKPSDLLLLSAAACSAYDVVMILGKQREPLEGLEVTCAGDQNADPPYAFTHLHLHYIAYGAVSEDKLARAISLSEDKYCSVTNTLKPSVAISSDFEVAPTPAPKARSDSR
jgi:putative redox protein